MTPLHPKHTAPNQSAPKRTDPKQTDIDCSKFQRKLPELFETHADLSADEHLKSCENCSDLVRDLQYIAEQAKLLLPIHDPSPAVWKTIQSALKNEQDNSKQPPPGTNAPR